MLMRIAPGAVQLAEETNKMLQGPAKAIESRTFVATREAAGPGIDVFLDNGSTPAGAQSPR